jgi:CBS domain-containing protein
VRDFAIADAVVARENDPLWLAGKVMLENDASHVVVGRGTEAVGVTARHDLLKVFARSDY